MSSLLSTFTIWLLAILTLHTVAEPHDKITINIYAITTSFSVGKTLEKGHKIAIDTINANPSILSPYYINLTVLTAGDDTTNALLHALAISSDSLYIANVSYTVPILLGCDWSSLSAVTTPVLSAFKWAQLSSASTSVILSQTSSFAYFYRTIASDYLQAHSLILLCNTFNWTQIGIIHINDNYGVYLAVTLAELATTNDIQVNSIAFERNNNESYANAVSSMKDIHVYTIILISHGDYDIIHLFTTIKDKDMLRYPYFYIAVDGWLDEKIIQNIAANYSEYQGIIGTLPWQPIILNESYYNDTHNYNANQVRTMYKEAQLIYEYIEEQYHSKYENRSDPTILHDYRKHIPFGSRLIYGFESAMVFVEILQKLEEKYTLRNVFENENFNIIKNISNIILNEIEYLGVTGLVKFDPTTGDRRAGFYSFGCITDEGGIDLFGYSYFDTIGNQTNETLHETATSHLKFRAVIDTQLITWPKEFTSRGIIPQSTSFTSYKLLTIDDELFLCMTILAAVGIVSLLCYILYIVASEEKRQKKTNFALNLVIYTGVIMAYLNIILRGLDESRANKDTLNNICNVRIAFSVVEFTLILCPMFAKTYKLSRIFTGLLITESIPNKVLLLRVFIALCVDVILLCIFLSIAPFELVWFNGDKVQIDELHSIQYLYPRCSSTNMSVDRVFYLVVGGWKLLQMLFGIYVSMIVARMSFKHQIRTLLIICVAFIICVILVIFGPKDEPSFDYIVTCVSCFFVMNLIVFEKWLIKMWNIFMMKTNPNSTITKEDIELDDETKMRKLLKSRLEEIARAENWANTFKDSSNKYTETTSLTETTDET